MNSQMTNPMSEYLLKIQLIIKNAEFKNKEEADKYETLDKRLKADEYIRAVTKTDIFESYQYDGRVVYDLLIRNGYTDEEAFKYMNNPMMLPNDMREILMDQARAAIISGYKEDNKYYVNLMGKPYEGDTDVPADTVLRISDDFYTTYRSTGDIERSQPVHEMPVKYQDLYMNTEEYQNVLLDNPHLDYIRHLGSSAIPIHISRKARDGDVMKIDTSKLQTYHPKFGNVSVEPSVIHAFTNVYRSTRDYVYQTLRGDFSNIYANYNSLMRYLTIYMTIGTLLNEFQKKSTTLIYTDRTTANNMFLLYGFPSIIMEEPYLSDFLKQFRELLMDKGTNVVYRVKDIIGYEYTDVYTLVMVKQQVFSNGYPMYKYNEDGTKTPVSRIVFRRLGTTDENVSYFKFRNSTKEYSLDEIASGDPRWWNYASSEMDAILHDMNYTLSNSKYIQLSTHMSLQDAWWQCVIFLRGLLDSKSETKSTLINVNHNINGSTMMNLFDAVLALIIALHWTMKGVNGNTPAGNLYYPIDTVQCVDMLFNGMDGFNANPLKNGKPFKLASFNFDVDKTNPLEYTMLQTYEYLEPDTFIPMVQNVLDKKNANTADALLHDVKQIFNYLSNKVRNSRTIIQYRQATDAYNLLFLVDPIRNWSDDVYDPISIICNRYNITDGQYMQFINFFTPNSPETVTVNFEGTDYSIPVYSLLNENMFDYVIDNETDTVWYPFRNQKFMEEFDNAIKTPTFILSSIIVSSLPNVIKENYKDIILDKVHIDAGGNSIYGPTTFEMLLMSENSALYDYMMNQKDSTSNLVTIIKAIINGLADYGNGSLSALKYTALGSDEYIKTLKEIISYFKSYMVEFTKEEFILIFGGILDHGGNSDMLKLIDEIPGGTIEIGVEESLPLLDVSTAICEGMMADGNDGEPILYDDVLFRLKAAYKDIKNVGYDIWYDNGERITKTAIDIADDTEVIANFVIANGSYKIIVNIDNIDIIPPNYIGNVL